MKFTDLSVRYDPGDGRIKTTPEELAAAVFPIIAAINDYFGTSRGWCRRSGKKAKLYDITSVEDCLRFVKPCRNDIPGNIVPEWGYTINLYFCPFAPNRHIVVIDILWGDYAHTPMNQIKVGLRGQKDRALAEKIQTLLQENFLPDPVRNEIGEGYLYFGKDVPVPGDMKHFFESLL